MTKREIKRLLILSIPYVVFGLVSTNLGEAWRMAKVSVPNSPILGLMGAIPAAFGNLTPSFQPFDLCVGVICGVGLRLAVYLKGKNAKKYRHNQEYGSARWGNAQDIAPFMAPKFEDNIILTQTERLMMSNRPANPKNARNKNVLIVGGSGSGKTRFWLKPNLLQCHSSYVVTDPKGSIVVECGNALLKKGYRIKIFNTINFRKSMHYNPFAYIHSEKDILKLVTTLIANTKGEGKGGDEFWEKSEKLLYTALIAYIHYEAPKSEQNFASLLELLNAMEVREDDEEFQNPVDLMFEDLNRKKPNTFAYRQYRLYKLAAGLTAPQGMKSVFPTFTYPCHQSMITGTNPATHGIVNNGIYDPEGVHNGAWHWFANTRVMTLWEGAKKNGYWSASVAFPTSVGAMGDFIAPEFWWDGSELDSLFIDAVAKPQGMILEMEKDIGQYAGGLDLTDSGDAQRGKAAVWMLRNKIAPVISEKPFFMSAYFASFDESAHVNGVYSREAAESLQKIDAMLGQIIEEAMAITQGHLVVCVTSDHGTLDNAYNISPNVLLHNAGLIETDEKGKVVSWKAYSQRAGGTSEIRLADPRDDETRNAVKKILDALLADPDSGILEVVTGEEARKRGGFPDAAFVLVSRKGYELRDDVTGVYCRTQLTQKAQHGYSEDFPEMRASFMLTGEGIEKGFVEDVHLIDVAPTLAGIMGFVLPDAEGRDLLK